MSAIVRLKIVLKDVEPKVIRRIEVPLAIKLDRLHDVLQAVMGWGDYHLYEFRFRGDVGFGIPDPDWPDDMLDARKASLRSVLEDTDGKTFHYYVTVSRRPSSRIECVVG